MHPRLEDFISYAKSKGIIETLINTNATHLTSGVPSLLLTLAWMFLYIRLTGF